MNLFLISFLIILLNIPFGYWRAGERKFSLKWFLAIHIPVPIIILLRYYFNIGFEWCTYPIMITAFFTGQALGSWFRTKLIQP